MKINVLKTTFILTIFCFLQSCNPLGNLENVDPNLGQNNSANAGIQNAFWNFANSGDYTFDPNYISVTAGKATLLQVDQTHDEASDFAGGSHVGTQYVGGFLNLGNAGGCDATSTNCSELDSSWTPQYANLVGYWQLDGSGVIGNGSNIAAQVGTSGTSVDGSDGSMNYLSSQIQEGIQFDGVDDYITMGNAPELGFDLTSTFSTAFWFRPNDLSTQRTIISKMLSANPLTGWNIGVHSSGKIFATLLSFSPQNRITVRADEETLSPGNWYHVVVSYDGSSDANGLSIYINNKSVNETIVINTLSAPILNTAVFSIGSRNGQNSFLDAQVDDVAIWNSVLSPEHVNVIYNRQSFKYSGFFTSPVVNLGTSGSWTNIDWITNLPFGKELPGSSGNELSADYASLSDSTGVSGDSQLNLGLVALWHLNGPSWTGAANEIIDSSGNGNHGSAIGNTAVDEDSILGGRSGVFDGNTDCTDHGDNPNLELSLPLSFSIWFKLNALPSETNEAALISKYHSSNNREFIFSIDVNDQVRFLKSADGLDGTIEVFSSTTLVEANKWNHIVFTIDATGTYRFILNGKSAGTGALSNLAIFSGTSEFMIGCVSRTGGANLFGSFNGNLDEVAIWSRAIDQAEALELYRRGANRVRYQVRSCDDSACAGESWIGPDGTASTYFSELHNCASINAATGECDGNVQTSSPSLDFSEFVSAPVNNQYFQYRAILESDDQSAACAGGTQNCMPSVSSIEIGPTGRYFGGSPMIVNTTPVGFSSLSAFSETTGGACTVTYQASSDGITFYYWSGTAWAVASGVIQSNNAADINANISSFTGAAGAGSLFWRAFLTSDTSQDCELDELIFSF